MPPALHITKPGRETLHIRKPGRGTGVFVRKRGGKNLYITKPAQLSSLYKEENRETRFVYPTGHVIGPRDWDGTTLNRDSDVGRLVIWLVTVLLVKHNVFSGSVVRTTLR